MQEKAYGQTHDRVALTLDLLGRIALKARDPQTAQADFARALEIDRSLLGDDSLRTAIVKVDLAGAYMSQAKYVEAEAMLRPAVKVIVTAFPATDVHVGAAESSWGRALLHLKRYRDAEIQLSAGYQNLQKQARPPLARIQEVRQDLAAVYDAMGQPDQAKQFRGGLSSASALAAD
jgi:tetratricopeptide (TPR) repeat protein